MYMEQNLWTSWIVPLSSISVSVICALLIVTSMWGKFKQVIESLVGRVQAIEIKQDELCGNTAQAAMTHNQCNQQKIQCSKTICDKLDLLNKQIAEGERKRDEAREEVVDLKVQIAKIAQSIENWPSNLSSTKKKL